MTKMIASMGIICSLALGCTTPNGNLVRMNPNQVLAQAAREIDAKCPQFKMHDFEPFLINYYCPIARTNYSDHISVTYISLKPTHVQDYQSSTNVPLRTASDFQTAEVSLTPLGELQYRNIGEWVDYPEWGYIQYSQITTVKPKTNEPSNQAMHQRPVLAP